MRTGQQTPTARMGNGNKVAPPLKKVANFLKKPLTFYKINDTIVNVKNNKYF